MSKGGERHRKGVVARAIAFFLFPVCTFCGVMGVSVMWLLFGWWVIEDCSGDVWLEVALCDNAVLVLFACVVASVVLSIIVAAIVLVRMSATAPTERTDLIPSDRSGPGSTT